MPNIEVTATANVGQGVSGLKQLQAELGKTAVVAQKSDSSLLKMGNSLAITGVAAKASSVAINTVGSSLSNLVSGGVIAGIALLGVGLFELGKNLIGLSKAQKLANDALESGKDEYVKATLLVNDLKTRVQQAKDGFISKEAVLKDYNSTIGKTTGAVKTLDEAEQALVSNGPAYIRYTLLKAAAAFTAQKAAEKLFQAELENAKAAEANSRIRQDDIGEFIKKGEENIRLAQLLKKQKNIDLLNTIAADFEKQATEIAKGFKLLEQVKPVKIKKIKIEPESVELVMPRSGLLPQGSEAATGTNLTLRPDLTIVPNIKEIIVTPEQQQKVLDGLQKLFDAERLAQFQAETSALISQTIANIASSAISTASESIGAALAGNKDALPDLFGNLIKDLGSQISNLGKALVEAGVQMLIAKKAFEALNLTPQTAIIAGIALQILGAALKASFAKKNPGFATGVRNFEGGFATVGERGPERIFLPTGSSVQPNNEMQAYGGGREIFIPAVTLSGSDLVISFNRASAQMSRNG